MTRTEPLSSLRKVRGRFARSVNVERDAGSAAVHGYLPTGRSLDAVRRFARAMAVSDATRAMSITGPYGSGKSSLAIFLDALVSPVDDHARVAAEEILRLTDPDTRKLLIEGRDRLGAGRGGFVRAVVTANREPVTLTVLRALARGASRFDPPARGGGIKKRALASIDDAVARFGNPEAPRPTVQLIKELLGQLSALGPILLVVDEFGKNLEAFSDAPAEGDLFLLQQLAEWSHGESGLPLVTVTLQHLAFDEYVMGVTDAQRREWAKVQGRFEDIPYVDTARQTRVLIANAWEDSGNEVFDRAVLRWAEKELRHCRRAGLSEMFDSSAQIAGCWPLDPIAQLVLPELCSRYGQNERTLFSFLASREPLSIATFLDQQPWTTRGPLPVVGIDRVYDYFVDSASTAIGTAQSASRWLEIETTIRDAVGMSDGELRLLKTIGILNLVSAGGVLRASRATVLYAVANGKEGTEDVQAVGKLLAGLEKRGLLTFRDFADEYRLWQGSDFDMRTAIEAARRRLKTAGTAGLLTRVKPLSPLVAGRHSQQTHTLRSFGRIWVDATCSSVVPPSPLDPSDGLVVYMLGPEAKPPAVETSEANPKPVVAVQTGNIQALVDAAVELGALQDVLATEDRLETDWVARRELGERVAEASQRLDLEFERAFGSSAKATWFRLAVGRRPEKLPPPASASAVLSNIADAAYPLAPIVRNEMLNRTELTSQGSKARRVLLEAMVMHSGLDKLGIEGFGPDRAMYEAVLARPGIHRLADERWGISAPHNGSSFEHAWQMIAEEFQKARRDRVSVAEIQRKLMAPPIGMRAGIAPVLVAAALFVHSDDLAIYEHGTYRAALSPDLSERMVRNPAHFEIKHFASKGGVRGYVIEKLGERLGVQAPDRRSARNSSVLAVLNHLVANYVLLLPNYSRRTMRLSDEAIAVRSALLSATEPDILLFRLLPAAVNAAPVPGAADRTKWQEQVSWIPKVLQALEELRSSYGHLLDSVEAAIVEATGAPATDLQSTLLARVKSLETEVLDKDFRAFLSAISAPLEREEWLTYVSATIAGHPPEAWVDEERDRFFKVLHDIGATFRRIEAIHYERRAHDGVPFDAVRVTFTRPDGGEGARVVWVDESTKATLTSPLDDLLSQAADAAGSVTGGLDALLALLATYTVPVRAVDDSITRKDDPVKGSNRGGRRRG